MDMLKQYICWVKEAFQPEMSRDAEDTLLAYWQMARSKEDRQTARSTVRMLESLIRLSQVRLSLQNLFSGAFVNNHQAQLLLRPHAPAELNRICRRLMLDCWLETL